MFASDVKSTVAVDGGEVVIRKLSARSLEKASEARQAAVAATTRNLGKDMLELIRSSDGPNRPAPDPAVSRYGAYDRFTVLTQGVVSWSFDRKVDQASLDDLDEGAAEKLFRAIVDLSVPTREQSEASEKNA